MQLASSRVPFSSSSSSGSSSTQRARDTRTCTRRPPIPSLPPLAASSSSTTTSISTRTRDTRRVCPPLALPPVGMEAAPAAAAAAEAAPGLGGLLATCALMFLAAYGAGMAPTLVSVSEQRLASVSAAGAGLLLGSALTIILPEGFEAAMHAGEESGLPEWSVPLALLSGFWCMMALDSLSHWLPASSGGGAGKGSGGTSRSDPAAGTAAAAAAADYPDDGGSRDDEADELVILLSDMPGREPRPGSTSSRPSTPKGSAAAAAAAAGEPCPAKSSGGSSSGLRTPQQQQQQLRTAGSRGSSSSALSRLGAGRGSASAAAAAAGSSGAGPRVAWLRWLHDPSQQALLGLLVHAASDGLAVGAASLSKQPAVSVSVAAAMVVHKGPVAVGLAAFLRAARWTPAAVHKGILAFALASPAAALLVYLLLQVLPVTSSGSIPLAVLYSGGTVLYAATMHILPSALGGGGHHHGPGAAAAGRDSGGSQRDLLSLVSLGMVLPLLLTVVFHPEHQH